MRISLAEEWNKDLVFPPDVNFIKFSYRSLSVKSQKKAVLSIPLGKQRQQLDR